MLMTLKKHTSQDDITHLRDILDGHGLRHCLSTKDNQTILGLEENLKGEILTEIENLSSIERIIPTSSQLKHASREVKPEDTIIRIGDVEIGGNHITLMAGPCAIESEEQLVTIAEALKKSGVKILRASAYKPRTSPYSFQGLGEEGLKMHQRAQKKHGLLTETEVMDVRDVKLVCEHVDIIRIGARNMQNFDLLKEVGKCNKPVILKRGLSATIEEWLLCAEYIMAHGNHEVILCERGIRTFENATRSTLDLSSVSVARRLTHLPIIVDPSHAAGRADIIPDLSKAAVAIGAHGLLIEVHPNPRESRCDARQALSPKEFGELVDGIKGIANANGKTV